jgi:hypothetical protein
MSARTVELRLPARLQGRRPLIVIVLLGALLRLSWSLYQGDTVQALPGVHDQITYHTLALRVLHGQGFSFDTGWWPATQAGAPTAHWSFLYTLYLAAVYLVFGVHPAAARLIQSLAVAVLHPWLSWRIGRRLFGEQAGLAAALFASAYGYFIYYAGCLMTESFFVVAILWSLDIATAMAFPGPARGSPPRRSWTCLGVAAGAAVLLRQVFLLFVPFLLGWLVRELRRSDRREGRARVFRGVATAGVVMLAMILPWTARNYLAFKRFVLLNTNAGFAFFWANHPVHGSRFIPVLNDDDRSYGRLIPEDLRNQDEATMDRELLGRGLRFAIDDPKRYLMLSLSRAKEYFRFWPSGGSGTAGNLARALSFGLFLPFMVIGVLSVLGRCFRARTAAPSEATQSRCSGHFLLLLFVSVFTLIHLLSWALIRYRLPVDGVLLLYAGAGVLWLARRSAAVRPLFCKGPVV